MDKDSEFLLGRLKNIVELLQTGQLTVEKVINYYESHGVMHIDFAIKDKSK